MQRSEIDLGILSRDEAAIIPRPLDAYQRNEEDWLYLSLYLARGARVRASKTAQGTPDFYAERYAQDMAIEAAKFHASNLRLRGYHFTADLASMMAREGAA